METPSTKPVDTDSHAIAKHANRALLFSVLGLFLFPLLGLIGWFFGQKALNGIRRLQTGIEHRGAAQFGVIVGIYSLVVGLLIAVVALRDVADLG